MKVKIDKQYPLIDGKFVIGYFERPVKETKQYYILDNISTADIELLVMYDIQFSIIKQGKTYTYNDSEWRE